MLDRWRAAWRSVVLAATTAAATWEIAARLLGHDRPTFAAITAVVCLSPGLSSRGRQALGLLVGVAVGVAVGAALRALGTGTLTGVFASTLLSMLAAASFDINHVQIIQAGASALLVIATGAPLGLRAWRTPPSAASSPSCSAKCFSRRTRPGASKRVTALARASVEALARGDRDAAGAQAKARMACFAYIEGFYNPLRLHSGLGYRSPTDYERSFRHDQASPMTSLPEQVH